MAALELRLGWSTRAAPRAKSGWKRRSRHSGTEGKPGSRPDTSFSTPQATYPAKDTRAAPAKHDHDGPPSGGADRRATSDPVAAESEAAARITLCSRWRLEPAIGVATRTSSAATATTAGAATSAKHSRFRTSSPGRTQPRVERDESESSPEPAKSLIWQRGRGRRTALVTAQEGEKAKNNLTCTEWTFKDFVEYFFRTWRRISGMRHLAGGLGRDPS